jgi:DNA polymerase I-like protein with 3'-5' exonuclease and polymerase domains
VLKNKYGWEPVKKTEKGTPVVDDEVLQSLASKYEEAGLLAEYFLLKKRIGQVAEGKQGWLKVYDPSDNRIHGYVNTMGTRTFRMSHSKPNLAQVPAGRSPWGKECRELFTVPEGCKLVGCDASGLELRGLAHFLGYYDKGEYAKAVIHGNKEEGTDAHTLNMKALGLSSRDDAKTWFYAFIYGAGNAKLGAVMGNGAPTGGKMRKAFLKNMVSSPRLYRVKPKHKVT